MKNSRHKKTPSVRAQGVSGNEINFGEEIVMSNATAIPAENNVQRRTAAIVPFRSAKLLLVEHEGHPFVPMKPVVEGMGLTWQSQHVKLTSGRFNTCITEIVIQLPGDSQRRPVTCLPLRKLTGWLMSIHPGKVREALRDDIIAYQNECDDVLWSHWNQGHVSSGVGATVAAALLGLDGARTISNVIRNRVAKLDVEHQRSAGARISSALHTRFGVPRIELIPFDQMDSACNFVAAFAIEGEYLPKQEQPLSTSLDLEYSLNWMLEQNPDQFKGRTKDGELVVTVTDMLNIRRSPCLELLDKLNDAGYDIQGAFYELRSYQNIFPELRAALSSAYVAAQSQVKLAQQMLNHQQKYVVEVAA